MSTVITKFIGIVQKHQHSDTVDQLNYYYTTLILLFFTLFIGCEQKLGSPIKCWVPPEFRPGWESYVDSYCYVTSTYYLPLNASLSAKAQNVVFVNYYQWVPFIFLLQASIFFTIDKGWKYLIQLIDFNFAAYLILKILYLINVCSQLYIINKVFKNLFPFITLCTFDIRELGNLHTYTVQCLLPINMLNEKLFYFLWFWFLLLATCIFINMIYYCVIFCRKKSSSVFI